jgi:hypothetical protein
MNFILLEVSRVLNSLFDQIYGSIAIAISVFEVALIDIPSIKVEKTARPVLRIIGEPSLLQLPVLVSEDPAFSMPSLPVVGTKVRHQIYGAKNLRLTNGR